MGMEIEINPGIEGMIWRWRWRWNPLICISISITVMYRSSVRVVHMCMYVHVCVCTWIEVGKEVNMKSISEALAPPDITVYIKSIHGTQRSPGIDSDPDIPLGPEI